MQPELSWQSLGRHRYRIDGDTLWAVALDEINAEEGLLMCEKLLQVYREHGYVFEILDVRQGGAMGAEARRVNAAWHRDHPIEVEVIVLGANVLLRTVVTLFSNAVRLLGRSQLRVQFVASEEEALARVVSLRDKRRSGASS